MYCNYNIRNYVLYRGLWSPGNVFYHNKVSSYGTTHSYFWVVCRCSVGTTVTITSVIMCCTEVCGHLLMSFITIKSLHIDLLIHYMCCTEVCSHLVMSFITIKSLHIDRLIYNFGWYADVLWVQLVHSFDQVVGRVILCGHLIIHTV